ncbi:MAG: hypothetical protein HWE16_10925 [Gammaproteobacteria bacterium]|nr:hypothetical protein [Gammaproteobacteria bacterium]
MKKISMLILVCCLFSLNTAEASVKRSCESTFVQLYLEAKVGSAWLPGNLYLSTEYLQKGVGFADVSPEKARKRACKNAAQNSVKYALSMNTHEDFARLACKKAKELYADRHQNAGDEIKLTKVFAYAKREKEGSRTSLGNKVFNCQQLATTSLATNSSSQQFCQNYAVTSIKIDKAMEQLGCSVQHHSSENHEQWCSKRSTDAVLAGVRQKRAKLDSCIDKLPLK